MFAAKTHESSKTKAENTPAQVTAKRETAERVQVNPLWNLLATGVQAKLTVSAPDDPYEREADRVADQIMRMLQSAVQRACPASAAGGPPCPKCQQEKVFAIHRKADASGDIAGASVPAGFLSNLGPGRPLDANTRAFMEPRFGHDFGPVRVHTGAPQGLQASLTVNQPGDEYEQEADRVAEQVLRMPEPRLQRQAAPEEEEEEELLQTKPLLQRQELEGEEEDEEFLQTKPLLKRRVNDGIGTPAKTPAIVHDVPHSPGQPLDPATRAFMEPRFGHDFNDLRVHTDDEAAESARAVDARAFTVGQDVVFGKGQYAKTSEGVRLLAHELTHVVQQGGHYIGTAGFIQRQEGNVGGGDAAETLSTCDQPSGIDTITFAPHLVTDVRTVQLYYRKEEPPGGKVQIHYAELLGNLFTEEPLLKIVVEQSCGDWIRFDITDKPPGWQGPSLEDDSITMWGMAPPSPGRAVTSEVPLPGMIFVADQFLFDLIIRQRQFTREDDEEAFDLTVIDEFFRGIGEGLGADPYKKGIAEGLVQDLSTNWNTLFQIYAKHAVFFPILQYNLWLGAMDGIAEEGAEILVSLTQFAEDPQAFIDQVMEAIGLGIMQPESTARQFGRAIGADLKQQLEKLINKKTQEDPNEFLYELGKIVGPVLLNIILTLLAPEAYILRGVAKAGGLLLDFVDDVFDLSKIGTIHWKPSIAKNLDVPGALTRVGEILRSGGIRLKSGHEIRIIDNMLERCSSCSILARVYSPVLDSQLPEANDLRNEVAELQREVDELLAEGIFRKEEILANDHPGLTIEGLANRIEALAKRNNIEFDRLTEENVRALEALFGDNTGAIDSLAALGKGATNTLLGLPEPTQYVFRTIWQRPSKEYRDAAARILTDSRLTNQNQITKALEQVYTASDQALRGEPALVRMISRSLVPELSKEWTNRAFQPTTARLRSSQGWIDPRRLLYGQGGADPVFQKPGKPIPIQSMANLLSDKGKSWEDVHKELGLAGDTRHSVEITQLVVGPEEIYLFTLDHRRIICAQAAYDARGGLVVPYTVVKPDVGKMDLLRELAENPSKDDIRDIFRKMAELGKSIEIR